ncbi:endonuclease/exonuclease/phosphatase family protein, partial [Nocardia sp. CWNU-33]
INAASGRPEVISNFLADAKAEIADGSSVIMGGDLNEPSLLDWNNFLASPAQWGSDHKGIFATYQLTE